MRYRPAPTGVAAAPAGIGPGAGGFVARARTAATGIEAPLRRSFAAQQRVDM